MTNILINKIKKEFADVYGVTAISPSKKIIYIYVLNEIYKSMINDLLKEKFNSFEIEHVKVVVTGAIKPLASD